MNATYPFASLTLLTVCALASGCSGLDTGNAKEIGTVELALAVGPGAPVDASGAKFSLTAAFATVRHVELYLPAGASCAGLPGLSATEGDHTVTCDGDKIRARGPWRIDLLTRAATPALPLVPVVPGTYRRIDVRFTKDVTGVTLGATGTVPLSLGTMPFRLELDFERDVRFEGTDLIASEDAIAHALLTLDPTGWFAALPLVLCAESGDLDIDGGVLQLEDGGGACAALEDTVEAAIGGSGVLEDDDTDD